MEKRILKEGVGLFKPNERGTVTISVTCKEKDKIILNEERREIVLGKPADELWYRIEKCILTMKEGEKMEEMIGEDRKIMCCLTLLSFERAIDFWLLNTQDKLTIAQEYKDEGNKNFTKGQYKMAAMFYSKSLKYIISTGEIENDIKIACLNNMAACQLKLGHYHHCVTNCTKILSKRPLNSKALYRKGCAHFELKELEEAEKNMIKANEIEKGRNQSVSNKLKEIRTAKESSDKNYQETITKMFKGK